MLVLALLLHGKYAKRVGCSGDWCGFITRGVESVFSLDGGSLGEILPEDSWMGYL